MIDTSNCNGLPCNSADPDSRVWCGACVDASVAAALAATGDLVRRAAAEVRRLRGALVDADADILTLYFWSKNSKDHDRADVTRHAADASKKTGAALGKLSRR